MAVSPSPPPRTHQSPKFSKQTFLLQTFPWNSFCHSIYCCLFMFRRMLRSGPGLFFQGPWKNVFSCTNFFKLFLSLALTSTIHLIIIVTRITFFLSKDFFKPAQPLKKIVKTFDLTLSKLNTLNLNAQIHKAGSFQNLKKFWKFLKIFEGPAPEQSHCPTEDFNIYCGIMN